MSTPVPSSHITIEENVERLKRFAWLEHAAMRTLAGWLPGAPDWDAKNAFGLHVGSLRATRCRSAAASVASSRPRVSSTNAGRGRGRAMRSH